MKKNKIIKHEGQDYRLFQVVNGVEFYEPFGVDDMYKSEMLVMFEGKVEVKAKADGYGGIYWLEIE